jgi:hypothetical protein
LRSKNNYLSETGHWMYNVREYEEGLKIVMDFVINFKLHSLICNSFKQYNTRYLHTSHFRIATLHHSSHSLTSVSLAVAMLLMLSSVIMSHVMNKYKYDYPLNQEYSIETFHVIFWVSVKMIQLRWKNNYLIEMEK